MAVPAGCEAKDAHPQLLVNMVAGVAGYLAVAIDPADSKPPPSPLYGPEQANPLKGNAIAAVASWDQGGGANGMVSSLAPWTGRQVRQYYYCRTCMCDLTCASYMCEILHGWFADSELL